MENKTRFSDAELAIMADAANAFMRDVGKISQEGVFHALSSLVVTFFTAHIAMGRANGLKNVEQLAEGAMDEFISDIRHRFQRTLKSGAIDQVADEVMAMRKGH